MIKASICTIGDEILIGQIIDTNSSHIAQALNKLGIKVTRILSISDTKDDIIESLSNELVNNHIVITTGGLGPTKDDITKDALAELSKAQSYIQNQEQLEVIKNLLSPRGLDTLDINIAQASVPDTCEVIVNEYGTAPVMVFHFPEYKFKHKTSLYSLPGIPYEALGVLDKVMENIASNYPLSNISHRSIMTYGMAESSLAKKIESWEANLDSDMHLAYLPNPINGIKLRLSVYEGISSEERISRQIEGLKAIIGDIIYSEREDTLINLVSESLKQNKLTISLAESCTGGFISSLFTSIPGSSEYYLGSITSYSNDVKEKVINVDPSIIAKYGAVSAECAAAMADGIRKITLSDYSLSATGIAGPGGGSPEKPIGTLWIGVSSNKGTETYKFTFNKERKENILRFSGAGLYTLLKKLKSEINL